MAQTGACACHQPQHATSAAVQLMSGCACRLAAVLLWFFAKAHHAGIANVPVTAHAGQGSTAGCAGLATASGQRLRRGTALLQAASRGCNVCVSAHACWCVLGLHVLLGIHCVLDLFWSLHLSAFRGEAWHLEVVGKGEWTISLFSGAPVCFLHVWFLPAIHAMCMGRAAVPVLYLWMCKVLLLCWLFLLCAWSCCSPALHVHTTQVCTSV